MFYVYIIYSAVRNKFYVGHSADLEKRLLDHNNGLSKYTRIANDWKVVYIEIYETREEAWHREMEIKRKKSRKYIEWLIAQHPK